MPGVTPPPSPENFRRAVDTIRHHAPSLMRQGGAPGLSIAIADASGHTETFCFGVTRAGAVMPVTPATVFQVGSISKSISAVAIARLPYLGVMSLDEPIVPRLRSWQFPQRLAAGRDLSAITMRSLLCHSAGLNIHVYPYHPLDKPLPSAAQVLDAIDGPAYTLEWVGTPGRTINYASAHFVLAALVVEDVTGETFDAWAHRTLLLPLGLHDSSFLLTPEARARLAHRHTGADVPLPVMQRAVLASSNLHTSARDLVRVTSTVLGLARGDSRDAWFMPRAIAQDMLTPQPDWSPDRAWGLGWYFGHGFQQTSFKAGGAFEGVWAWLEGFPSTGISVAILTNAESGQRLSHPLMRLIRPILLGDAAKNAQPEEPATPWEGA